MIGNVLSAPVIVLLALRRDFQLAVGSALIDARQLSSIHREHGRPGAVPYVASTMADGLAAQLETTTKDLRGHRGLITYGRKTRDLARTCSTAAWGIMLSQQTLAVKAEALVDCMELLNTALHSWHPDASSQALRQFPVIASGWPFNEGQ